MNRHLVVLDTKLITGNKAHYPAAAAAPAVMVLTPREFLESWGRATGR